MGIGEKPEGEQFKENSYDNKEGHASILTAYKALPAVVEKFKSKQEPINSWNKMDCFSAIEANAVDVRLTTEDSVKDTRARVVELLSPYKQLISRVKDHKIRLGTSMTSKEKRDQTAKEKAGTAQRQADEARQAMDEKMKAEEAKRKQGIRAIAGAGVAAGGVRMRPLLIFDQPQRLLKPITSMPFADWKPEGL